MSTKLNPIHLKTSFLKLMASSLVLVGTLSASFAATILPGKTDAQVQILPTGSVNYTVPIIAPFATNGFIPKMQLSYNSHNGNGILGRGWSVSGLGSITRCNQSVATDGKKLPINFSSTDRFCLNGKRMVLVDGTYGQSGSEYRLEVNDNKKIQAFGNQAGAPSYFVVTTSDGMRYSYGATTDSRVELQNSTRIYEWALNRVEDLSSNYINIQYQEDNARGTFYIDRIDYTGNSKADVQPYNSIEFLYSARPDPQYLCVVGSLRQTDLRLSEVKVNKNVGSSDAGSQGSEQTFRRYLIDYEDEGLLPAKSFSSDICSANSHSAETQANESEYQQILNAQFNDEVDYADTIKNYEDANDALKLKQQAILANYALLAASKKQQAQVEFDELNAKFEQAKLDLTNMSGDEIAEARTALEAQLVEAESKFTSDQANLDNDFAQRFSDIEARAQQMELDQASSLNEAVATLRQQIKKARRIFLIHNNSQEKKSLFRNFKSILQIKSTAASKIADDNFAAYDAASRLYAVNHQAINLENLPDGYTAQFGETDEAHELREKFIKSSIIARQYRELYEGIRELEPLVEKSEDNHGFHLITASQILRNYEAFTELLHTELQSLWERDLAALQREHDDLEGEKRSAIAEVQKPVDDIQYELLALSEDGLERAYDIELENLQVYFDEIDSLYAPGGSDVRLVEDENQELIQAIDNIKIIASYEREETYHNYQAALDELLGGDSAQIIAKQTQAASSLSGESRIASIMECGHDDTCMQPLKFDWHKDNIAWTSSAQTTPDSLISYDQITARGDGVYIDPNAVGNGDSSNADNSVTADSLSEELKSFGRELAKAGILVDINNDGLDDWVLAYREARQYEYRGTWLNTGTTWEYSESYTMPVIANNQHGTPFGEFIDINGDGFKDWVGAVRLQDGDVYRSALINTQTGWERSDELLFPNVMFEENEDDSHTAMGMFFKNQTDATPFWLESYASSLGANLSSQLQLVDQQWVESTVELPFAMTSRDEEGIAQFNGAQVDIDRDGRPDWVHLVQNVDGNFLKVWLNQADAWVAAESFSIPLSDRKLQLNAGSPSLPGQFIDLNNDGFVDWLQSVQLADGTVESSVLMNTGVDWQADVNLLLPPLTNQNDQSIAHLIDLNGDGVLDWLQGLKTQTGEELISAMFNLNNTWQPLPTAALPDIIEEEDQDGVIQSYGVFNRLSDDESVDWLNRHDIWDNNNPAGALLYAIDQWQVDEQYQLPVLEAQWLSRLNDLISQLETGEFANGASNLVDNNSPSTSSSSSPTNANSLSSTVVELNNGGESQGVMTGELVDLNGDGRVDWLKSIRFNNVVSQQVAWLRQDNGWVQHNGYEPPAFLMDFTQAVSSELVDLNADGLVDWLESYTKNGTDVQRIWRNTGSGWARDDSLALPRTLATIDNNNQVITNAVLSDINSDGLIDVLGSTDGDTWLNGVEQWQKVNDYSVPTPFWVTRNNKKQLGGELVDINGDGLSDWVAYQETSARVWLNSGDGWLENTGYVLPISLYSTQGHQQAILKDLNSDGLPDLALAYKPDNAPDLRNTWINTGQGWRQSDAYLLPGSLFHTDKGQIATLVDLNTDGNVDFIQAFNDEIRSEESVWLNKGHGWVKRADISIPQTLSSLTAEGVLIHQNIVMDVDGDHQLDFMSSYETADGEANSIRLGTQNVAGYIQEFDDGAVRSVISYAKGYKPNIVSKTTRKSHPERTSNGPSVVVADYQSFDTEDDIISDVSYAYGEPSIDVSGRGNLGFAWSEATDWVSGLVSKTAFRQDFPYIGASNRIDVSLLWGDRVKTSNHQYDVTQPLADGKSVTPYIKKTIVDSYKQSGGVLNQVVTEIIPDQYGQAKISTEVITESGKTYTTNKELVFEYDTSAWVLGNVTSQAIRKTSDTGSETLFSTQTFVNNKVKTKTEAGITETYDYNDFGSLIAVSKTGKIDAEGTLATKTESQKFDDKGRFAIETTDVDGQKMTYVYHDITDQPSNITAQDGTSFDYRYDAFGRKIQEIRWGEDDGKEDDDVVHGWAYRFCKSNDACPSNARYLLAMVDNDGESPETTFFDSLGREVRRVSADGDARLVNLDTEYDEVGRVARKTAPYSKGEAPRWGEFAYDAFGRTTYLKSPSGGIKEWRYDGRVVTEYNELGHPTTTTNTYFGAPALIVDADNNQTQYFYDAFGQLIRTVDANGNSMEVAYDARGNKELFDDPDHGRIRYTYNDFNQVLTKTDTLGNIEKNSYDSKGRFYQRTDVPADGSEPLVATWEYKSASTNPNLISRISSSDGYKLDYIYDGKGRETKATVTLPNGQSRTMETGYYGDSNLVATVKYPNQFSIRNVYDELGYLSEVKNGGLNTFEYYQSLFNIGKHYIETLAQPLHEEAKRIFDGEITDLQEEYKRRYDIVTELYADAQSLGRKIEGEAAKAQAHSRKMQGYIEQVLYYQENKEAIRSHPVYLQGQAERAACIKESEDRNSGLLGDDGELQFQSSYDCRHLGGDNIRKSVIDSLISNAAAERNIVRNYESIINRLSKSLKRKIDDAEDASEALNAFYKNTLQPKLNEYNAIASLGNTYVLKGEKFFIEAQQIYAFYEVESDISFWKAEKTDASNRVVAEVYANGIVSKKTYDPETGRLVGITTENPNPPRPTVPAGEENSDPASEGSAFYQAEQYGYDVAGNLILRSDGAQGTLDTFQYDRLDRLKSANYSFLNVGKTVSQYFAYDGIGNITEKSDIGTYTYDPLHPHAVKTAGDRQYTYDLAGRMKTGNGVTIDYTSFGKPMKLSNDKGEQVQFQYGPNRDRFYQRRADSDNVTETFYYFRGIYEEIVTDGKPEQKSYINVGNENIALLSGYAPHYELDETALPTYAEALFLAGEYAQELNKQDPPESTAEEEQNTEEEEQELTEDDIPQFFKPLLEGPEKSEWVADAEEGLTDAETAALREVLATDLLNILFYHKDAQGSVKAITDGSGALVSLSHYDAFGKAIYQPPEVDLEDEVSNDPVTSIEPNNAPDSSSYTGHESIGNLDLVHMNGRIYDPEIARFISADPLVPDIGNPQSLNRYAYVYNNPLKYVDLNGFKPSLADVRLDEYIFLELTFFFLEARFDPKKELYPLMRLTRSNPNLVSQRLASLGISQSRWAAASAYAENAEKAHYIASKIVRAKRKAKYVTFVTFAIGGYYASAASTGAISATNAAVSTTVANALVTAAITGEFDLGDFVTNLVIAYVGAQINLPKSDQTTTLSKVINSSQYSKYIAQGIIRGLGSHLNGGEFEHGFGAGLVEGYLSNKAPYLDKNNKGIGTSANIIRSAIIKGIVAEIANNRDANGDKITFADAFQLEIVRGIVHTLIVASGANDGNARSLYSKETNKETDYRAWGNVLNAVIEDGESIDILGAFLSAVSAQIQQEAAFNAWLKKQPPGLQYEVYLQRYLNNLSHQYIEDTDHVSDSSFVQDKLYLDELNESSQSQYDLAIEQYGSWEETPQAVRDLIIAEALANIGVEGDITSLSNVDLMNLLGGDNIDLLGAGGIEDLGSLAVFLESIGAVSSFEENSAASLIVKEIFARASSGDFIGSLSDSFGNKLNYNYDPNVKGFVVTDLNGNAELATVRFDSYGQISGISLTNDGFNSALELPEEYRQAAQMVYDKRAQYILINGGDGSEFTNREVELVNIGGNIVPVEFDSFDLEGDISTSGHNGMPLIEAFFYSAPSITEAIESGKSVVIEGYGVAKKNGDTLEIVVYGSGRLLLDLAPDSPAGILLLYSGAETTVAVASLGRGLFKYFRDRWKGYSARLGFSRVVPGGGLAAHEAAGGHLIARHVGKSEAQLLNRLASNSRITGSSSFTNLAVAESAVSATLNANRSVIRNFLSGNSNRIVVNHSMSKSIGIHVSRGATNATSVSSVRVILQRDQSLSTGYRIVTGFPTP